MSDNTLSLAEMVTQVAQEQLSQASEIENNREVLIQLQSKLYALETELKSVLLEAKAVEKQICQEEDTIDNITHLCSIQEKQNYSIYAENVRLKMALENLDEDFQAILSRNNKYREKVADNIKHFSDIENKLPAMIELIKQRDENRILKARKEEMMCDLLDPECSALKEKEEIEFLQRKVKEIKQLIAEKSVSYEKEIEAHYMLRKEVEVQWKRYDAILKRLHCQLKRAQLGRRRYTWNLERMEKTVADLKANLEKAEKQQQ
uniref:Coiled-coil domain-containing protein 122 n=1 Tax=Leptobrachium leishanense TaxID=445787 RepID=A0A8C5Q590_9ANUR